MLYEIHDIARFALVGDFISYCRLVKRQRESAGKKSASRNNKIGNVHLKWAFSEEACLFLRDNESAQRYHEKLVSRYGKAKGLSIIAQKIGRSVYAMLKRKEPFDQNRFFDSRQKEGTGARASWPNWNESGRSFVFSVRHRKVGFLTRLQH